MHFPARTVMLLGIVVLLAGLSGCDLVAELDRRTEPTLEYLAAFQGIDYRSRDELSGLRGSLLAGREANDVDAISRALSRLGEKYAAVADQAQRLDSTNADEDAVAYVMGFAELYRELAELHGRAAVAMTRNIRDLEQMQPEFEVLKQRIETMQSDRETLFRTLSGRYGGKDFNSVDYH